LTDILYRAQTWYHKIIIIIRNCETGYKRHARANPTHWRDGETQSEKSSKKKKKKKNKKKPNFSSGRRTEGIGNKGLNNRKERERERSTNECCKN
jgi:hypothetical protein